MSGSGALSRLGLAVTFTLGLAGPGCCAGPPERRFLSPPVLDAGIDAPWFLPFDASPSDGGALALDAEMDAAMDAELDAEVDSDAMGGDAGPDDAADRPDSP